MPLLGKDHLSRGRGEARLLNKVAYTLADLTVIYSSYLILFTDLGPRLSFFVLSLSSLGSYSTSPLGKPLAEVRPLQACLLMGGILLYFAKVLYWNWRFSHSNTISLGAVVLVGFGYYYTLIFSIFLSTYIVNRMPSHLEIALSVIIEPLSLLHELLVDWELAEFKRTKRRGELLDYGYHSACRHPNYFFNFFPLGALGLFSGSPPIGIMWVCIQIFWAYTQSGPGLEGYMAERYGNKWTAYCKHVPFVWPKPYRLFRMLTFQYVGDRKQKIKATGKMSMLKLDPKMLKELQKELELEEEDKFSQ